MFNWLSVMSLRKYSFKKSRRSDVSVHKIDYDRENFIQSLDLRSIDLLLYILHQENVSSVK